MKDFFLGIDHPAVAAKDVEISTGNMFERGHPERAVRIPHVPSNTVIILEGIVTYGSRYVIPAHVIDLSDGERLEADFDAALVILGEDGTEYVIDGVCFYGARGSDIVFDMPDDFPREIRRFPLDRIADRVSIRLNAVNVKLPPLHVSVNMTDQTADLRDPDVSIVRFSLEQALSRRLDYRAGQIGMTTMRMFFSEDVLTSPMFTRLYAPIAGLAGQNPVSAAGVIAMAIDGDRVYAVSAEYVDVMEYPFYINTQKIIAERELRQYMIVENTLIQ